MGRTKKVGVTGKFGSRYGLNIRRRILKVEGKKSYKCPFCNKEQLRRRAAGIWECLACRTRFTGGTHIAQFVEEVAGGIKA